MDEKDKKPAHENQSPEQNMPEATLDTGEYGIEQLLAPDEEALESARQQGRYHFSQTQLDHKKDRFEEPEEEGEGNGEESFKAM